MRWLDGITDSMDMSLSDLLPVMCMRARTHTLSLRQVASGNRAEPCSGPWTAARQASPSITNCRNLLKLMSIELMMLSSNLILCLLLLLLGHKWRIPLAVVLPPPARGAGTPIPSAQRLVWAAKQALGNAALGALFA